MTTDQLTTADIAARIGVEASTVRGYNSRGQMPEPSGKIGRTPYWTLADIGPWITERRTARVASHGHESFMEEWRP